MAMSCFDQQPAAGPRLRSARGGGRLVACAAKSSAADLLGARVGISSHRPTRRGSIYAHKDQTTYNLSIHYTYRYLDHGSTLAACA